MRLKALFVGQIILLFVALLVMDFYQQVILSGPLQAKMKPGSRTGGPIDYRFNAVDYDQPKVVLVLLNGTIPMLIFLTTETL